MRKKSARAGGDDYQLSLFLKIENDNRITHGCQDFFGLRRGGGRVLFNFIRVLDGPIYLKNFLVGWGFF